MSTGSPPTTVPRVSPWVVLRSAHLNPLIYRKMIGQVDPAARPGDVVNVYDKREQLFGRGLFNPRSTIVVRMLSAGSAPVDDAFWRERLSRALELRTSLRLNQVTDAYRLVHAEGDGLSGLIAERYADCIVCEMFSLGVQQRIGALTQTLAELLGPPAALDRPQRAAPEWRIVLRADEHIAATEGFRLPPVPESASVIIREHGVRYRVDMAAGHKTGFFCDQRDNRQQFAGLCGDATVLDLCCYSGGFGLCAKLLGGARTVTSVDLDEAALEMARENANLNQARIDLVHSDAFNYARQMLAIRRQYDAVVLDPPKFAPTRDALPEAERKYFDLNALAVRLVRPGGFLLTCSCSGLVGRTHFEEIVLRAARSTGRPVQILGSTGAAADHPVHGSCPETEYLKALWLRIL